jgi:hypothetical protein
MPQTYGLRDVSAPYADQAPGASAQSSSYTVLVPIILQLMALAEADFCCVWCSLLHDHHSYMTIHDHNSAPGLRMALAISDYHMCPHLI